MPNQRSKRGFIKKNYQTVISFTKSEITLKLVLHTRNKAAVTAFSKSHANSSQKKKQKKRKNSREEKSGTIQFYEEARAIRVYE